MKVCYFGVYNPKYPRNAVIIKGLKKNGVEVVECNAWPAKGLGKYFTLARKLLAEARGCDVLLAGFPGHSSLILAKLLFLNKKIVFDPCYSLFEMSVYDCLRSRFHYRSLIYYAQDFLAFKLADHVIIPTKQDQDYFAKRFFGSRTGKFSVIPIGADNEIFLRKEKGSQSSRNRFLVHFHGTFYKLHGVEHILRAAHILRNEPIEFNIAGKGLFFEGMRRLANELKIKNVNFLGWVRYGDLPALISSADVCLGLFGSEEKAGRAVPNKVFECMAMGRAVLTRESPAVDEYFKNGEDILTCKPASPDDLAEKILLLYRNEEMRERIAENGYKKYMESFTPVAIGRELKKYLSE